MHMRNLLTFGFVLLWFLADAHAEPKVFFGSGFPFDLICARGFDYEQIVHSADPNKYRKEWGIELKARVPEFQSAWDSVGPKLLTALESRFHRGFSRREYTATLSACAPSPSMPAPLLLNVTRYLRSYTAPKAPKSLELFPDLPFHELLHIWLDENYPRQKKLERKYKDETPGVTSHMYLFAVEGAVYEELKMLDLWSEVRGRFIRIGGPHKRALEILDLEGQAVILKDLE
jgi:hypothetical protein